MRPKRHCPLTAAKIREVDYKDVDTISKFISEDGKIIPRRVSGLCARMQRRLEKAAKRARQMALLHYTDQHRLTKRSNEQIRR